MPSVTRGAYDKAKFHANGKNPGDVWGDIKQLTYKSKELVSRDVLNTIQKPWKLLERLVKASLNVGDFVLDAFCGAGTTLVACPLLQRSFIGFEQNLILLLLRGDVGISLRAARLRRSVNMSRKIKRIIELLRQAQGWAGSNGIDNLFQPGLIKEMIIAELLGHIVIAAKHGADTHHLHDPTIKNEYLSCKEGGTG